jgi:glycosyltransferase involved in cell wall biosynthesis
VRMEQMLKALLQLGCRVTFLPDDHQRWEPYTRGLQALGVEVLYAPMTVPAEIAAIGERMKLAIVSRPYVATRYLHMLREHAPAARIVYDTVDLHYLREARRSKFEGPGAGGAAKVWKEIELALVRVTDVTSVVSEAEREELAREVPGAHVALLPLANAQLEEVPPAEGRAGLLFVGGFQHQPNADAAKWLVEAILPLVRRELGEIPVTIVGPDPPPAVLALNGDGVEVAGWVKDLQPLLDGSRVMVAPLRYGAGVKGKVTQSLAAGLPVVTTTIGAEGLNAQDGREMLIADDPAGLAERIVRAYRDDALWGSLSEAGRDLVGRTASPDSLRRGVAALLRDAS